MDRQSLRRDQMNHISEFESSGSSPGISCAVYGCTTVCILSLHGIRRRSQNPLPTIRIGRYLRFDWVSVSAWLRQQERAV
jgi:hypothetical protein